MPAQLKVPDDQIDARENGDTMTSTLPAQRTVLEKFPAGHPRGSWPADEYAADQRAQGRNAHVVMDLTTDQFLVVTDTTTR